MEIVKNTNSVKYKKVSVNNPPKISSVFTDQGLSEKIDENIITV